MAIVAPEAGAMARKESGQEKKTGPTQQDLELAAYYRWVNRGCPDGDALSDWVEVEKHWDGKPVPKTAKKKT